MTFLVSVKNIHKLLLTKYQGRFFCFNYCTYTKFEMGRDSIVGLEVHAQILSKTKLFSRSSSRHGKLVNSSVSFFDASIPGTLPVISKKCVECAVSAALALNCEINKVSKFDRKHYFYADLPAGYQITQKTDPIARNGLLKYNVVDPSDNKIENEYQVRIKQIQLEQDSGKSYHDEETRQSFIDLNRCGIALMEIVTEPDFSSGKDAAVFVSELLGILKTLKVCDGKMSEGSLRVDANVSINRGNNNYGIITEIKNISSIKAVQRAIDMEIERHIHILNNGGEIVNETLYYNSLTNKVNHMRDKEVNQDYRFFPDPNLPALVIYDNSDVSHDSSQIINIDLIRQALPQLPDLKRQHLRNTYNISLLQCMFLVNEPKMAEYFEETLKHCSSIDLSSTVYNIMSNVYLGVLNARSLTFEDTPLNAKEFSVLCNIYHEKRISYNHTIQTLTLLVDNPARSVLDVINANDWWTIHDEMLITQACLSVIDENPELVTAYKKGKHKVIDRLFRSVQDKVSWKGESLMILQSLQKHLANK